MSKLRYSLLLAVPMLLGTGTAYAGTITAATNPVAVTFIQGTTAVAVTDALTFSASGATLTAPVTNGTGGTWLAMSNLTVTGTSATVSFTPIASIANALAPGTYTATVNFTAASYTTLAVPVTLTVYSNLTAASGSPNPVSVSYTLGGGPGTSVALTLNSSVASMAFAVGTAPSWLTVTPSAATAGTTTPFPATVNFQANAVAGAMLPGSYTGTVTFVSSTTNTTTPPSITVVLSVHAATVSDRFTATSTNANVNYNPSESITGVPITVQCSTSGEDVGFAVSYTSSGNSLATNMSSKINGVATSSGIAYPWGTTVTVTVAGPYLAGQPFGSSQTGAIVITPNNGAAAITIPVTVYVTPGAPTITSYSVAYLPVDLASDHTIVVTGSNFVQGVTTVKARLHSTGPPAYTLVDAGHIVIPSTSTTSMILTLDHSAYLSAAYLLDILVSNDGVTWYPTSDGTPTGTPTPLALTTTTQPIIYAVTDGGSFVQPASGALSYATVAPFEIISIFGANFDKANGVMAQSGFVSGSNGSGNPDTFLNTIKNSNGDSVIVTFCITSTLPAACSSAISGGASPFVANAPLIFVSNNQINAIVPMEVAIGLQSASSGADILVTVGSVASNYSVNGNSGSTATTPFLLNTATQHPGIFTTGGSGVGQAAVLLGSTYTLNSSTNPAIKANNPVLHIFLTGMGDPGATGTNADTSASSAAASGVAYPGNCISEANYITLISTAATTGPSGAVVPGWNSADTSLDGVIFNSANFWPSILPPCFPVVATPATSGVANTGVVVQLGTGAYIQPSYAGFAPGGVAGLYQVDVTILSSYTYAPTLAALNNGGQMPLTVYVNNVATQPGVYVYVQ